ncbi:alpha-1,3-mannosyltransferase [Aphelenchoides avenae]|nr:alpha-1,3-mannosyltransferase [Aphelenchus avenae]
MRVTFLHPDLGIGGAERLVVDAALALRAKEHSVKFVTNHFSPDHCFKDVMSFDIKVINVFPRSIFGKMHALCAYIRLCLASIYVCWTSDADVIFSDQISAPLPILRAFSPAKQVFYCHFPDQLLTTRKTLAKQLYRSVIDWFECWTTGFADLIFVNSKFTEGVVRETMPSLASRHLHVLYPSLNTKFFDDSPEVDDGLDPAKEVVFLSLNRFEVKKNIGLALEAFAKLREAAPEQFDKCLLVVAGGYDKLNSENILHHQHLCDKARDLDIFENTVFVKSPRDDVKVQLLRRCRLLLYTPTNEHFGIVPLEAMYMRRPVVATNTGGPTETVVDGKTGFLCTSDAESFCEPMLEAAKNPKKFAEMGENGHRRVVEHFAFDAFADKLNEALVALH